MRARMISVSQLPPRFQPIILAHRMLSHDLPRCGLEAQQAKFDGQPVFIVLDVSIDALCIGIQDAFALLRQARNFGCRCPVHAQAAAESVSFKSRLCQKSRRGGPSLCGD